MNNNIENKAIETSNNKDAAEMFGMIPKNFYEIGVLADQIRTAAADYMETDSDLIKKAYRIANEICELVGHDEEI